MLDNLDNSLTGGIDRVAMGLLSTSPAFNAAVAGVPIVFTGMETSDDQVFWSDFESTLPGNVEPNQLPLMPQSMQFGTTCGGSELLPHVAYGTASLHGPVAIHPVSLSGGSVMFDLQGSASSPLMMFLCPVGAGPSGACLAAGLSGVPIVANGIPPGDYQLVVGASQINAACVDYTISRGGTLDD